MSRPKKKINQKPITTNDLYTLSLFALWKLQEIPEYSATSELMYILDKESVLKLIEYYGGQTIKIPTIEEVQTVLYTVLLYQYIQIDKFTKEEALAKIQKNAGTAIKNKVEESYEKLVEILHDYNIDIFGN